MQVTINRRLDRFELRIRKRFKPCCGSTMSSGSSLPCWKLVCRRGHYVSASDVNSTGFDGIPRVAGQLISNYDQGDAISTKYYDRL